MALLSKLDADILCLNPHNEKYNGYKSPVKN